MQEQVLTDHRDTKVAQVLRNVTVQRLSIQSCMCCDVTDVFVCVLEILCCRTLPVLMLCHALPCFAVLQLQTSSSSSCASSHHQFGKYMDTRYRAGTTMTFGAVWHDLVVAQKPERHANTHTHTHSDMPD